MLYLVDFVVSTVHFKTTMKHLAPFLIFVTFKSNDFLSLQYFFVFLLLEKYKYITFLLVPLRLIWLEMLLLNVTVS